MNELEQIFGIQLPKNIKISRVVNTTDKVIKDSIFFGLQGTRVHGSRYADKALELGASLVIHNDPDFISKHKNIFYIKDLNDKLIMFLNAFYNIDINSNNFYAFTGTNGKTSAAYLTHQLLQKMNYDSVYIGTLGVKFNKEEIDTSFSKKTTPDIFELFEIVNSINCKMDSINVCMELSSHALDQKRIDKINRFYSLSIINIRSDHLDYHLNIDAYIDSKFEIFRLNSSIKLIDAELLDHSKSYDFINNNTHSLISISNRNNFSDIFFNIEKLSLNKCIFSIQINNPPVCQKHEKNKKYKFFCKIFPEYNISNLVFAICSIGFDEFSENEINDLSYLKLPKGRLELIQNIPANIIIDYAHNEHSFHTVLSSLKEFFENLIVVYGCGGNRDKSKRSKMLSIATEHCAQVIFTTDNSRSESFNNILADSIKGNDLDKVISIEDRKKAIIRGSELIKEEDCLLILGKGHEVTQDIGGEIKHFSDHEVINEIYK